MPKWLCSLLLLAACSAQSVSISNKNPRMTTDGKVVNAHGGNIVQHPDGTYLLYGEYYGEGHFVVTGNTALPRLSVYSSLDLVSWSFLGLLHNNSNGSTKPWADSGHWPWHPSGAWYSPEAVYVPARKKFVLYFTASAAECCTASWGVAESDDGVNFELLSMNTSAAVNTSLDGSSLLIDDDGVGYVAYTAMGLAGRKDHVVAIDRLAPDMHSSVEQLYVFDDFFVEGAVLFKRSNMYYVIYGSCCCACRQGSGAVVHSAKSIRGPWTKQTRDVNCALDAPICAGMPASEISERPLGQLTINAQGLGLSVLPVLSSTNETDPTLVYIWHGARWLSAPNNPANCTLLCAPNSGQCAQPDGYIKGHDFDYWIPLEFDELGAIKQFDSFVDQFELNLPKPAT
eukprot:TRINITY_DN3372_c0_g1_i1.p1 TRINITY_DN3372_c0_g1~~TRINITY_DN3372_c0_g1_i1.p1  ORF type:complete len:399 (-),score=60.25 TRINITY_DN3372_c0_g1_i1:166-1362(-)